MNTSKPTRCSRAKSAGMRWACVCSWTLWQRRLKRLPQQVRHLRFSGNYYEVSAVRRCSCCLKRYPLKEPLGLRGSWSSCDTNSCDWFAYCQSKISTDDVAVQHHAAYGYENISSITNKQNVLRSRSSPPEHPQKGRKITDKLLSCLASGQTFHAVRKSYYNKVLQKCRM